MLHDLELAFGGCQMEGRSCIIVTFANVVVSLHLILHD
jgi:hypothetical protein